MEWRRLLYDNYVSSGQADVEAASSFRGKSAYIDRVIAEHLPPDHAIRILDLGCGTGDTIDSLKKHGYRNVTGVDASAEMIEVAHGKGHTEARLGDIRTELGAIADASTDVIFLMDVLEHFDRADLFDVCSETVRVLVPGGRIVAHVPNAEGIFGARVRYGDLTHELAFTPSSARQLFRTLGIKKITCYEHRPIPHGLKSNIRALLWIAGTVGFRLLFAAETGGFDCILSQNMLIVAEK